MSDPICEFFAKHDILIVWFLLLGIIKFVTDVIDMIAWWSKGEQP